MTKELVDYISNELTNGIDENEIYKELARVGWEEKHLKAAFTNVKQAQKHANRKKRKIHIPFSKIIFHIGVILLIIIIGGFFYTTYSSYIASVKAANSIEKILIPSILAMGQVQSYNVTFTSSPLKKGMIIAGSVDVLKNPKSYGKAEMRIQAIGGNPTNNLTFFTTYNRKNAYLSLFYPKLVDIEEKLIENTSGVTTLQTYKVLRSLLMNKVWLDISFDNSLKQKKDSAYKKLTQALIVRKNEDVYLQDGQQYQHIILGFDKAKLLGFVDELQKSSLPLTKDITMIKKAVIAGNNWDNDLIEILIAKNTMRFVAISFSLPNIQEDAIKKILRESQAKDKENSFWTELLSENISSLIKGSTQNNIHYLGRVLFSNYNIVKQVEKPREVVEYDHLLSLLSSEFIPQGIKKQPLKPSLSLPLFKSTGKKAITPSLTVYLTGAAEMDETVKIAIALTNTSKVPLTLSFKEIVVKTKNQEILPLQAQEPIDLAPNQTQEIELMYTKSAQFPYTFYYISSDKTVVLGSYAN